jgi:hypothetical protein
VVRLTGVCNREHWFRFHVKDDKMKNNKFFINKKNILNSEELKTLRGGGQSVEEEPCCLCKEWNGTPLGYMLGANPGNCNSLCFYAFGTGYGVWECII